jgi:hypothetical protein
MELDKILVQEFTELVHNISNDLNKRKVTKTTSFGSVQSSPTASGQLAKSVSYTKKDLDISLQIFDYYKYLTRQHFGRPPVNVILNWMKNKGIATNEDIEKQKGIAFAISKSISKKGTRPQYITFVDDRLKEFNDKIGKKINDSYLKDLTNKISELWLQK